MTDKRDIVTVNLTIIPKAHEFEFAVLVDKSLDDVIAFHAKHHKCFVFIFYTSFAQSIAIGKRMKTMCLLGITQPMYVGNIANMNEGVKQWIKSIFDTSLPTGVRIQEIEYHV